MQKGSRSVADPGCLSRIQISFPDPGSKRFRIRIRNTGLTIQKRTKGEMHVFKELVALPGVCLRLSLSVENLREGFKRKFFVQPISFVQLYIFAFLVFKTWVWSGRCYFIRTNDGYICINQTNMNLVALRSGSVRINCIYSLRTRTSFIQLFLLFIIECADDQRSHRA